jgi:hypothetical protein
MYSRLPRRISLITSFVTLLSTETRHIRLQLAQECSPLHHPHRMRFFKSWVESWEGIAFCQGLLKTFPSLPKFINPLFFGEQESYQRFMVTLSSSAYFTSDTIVYVSADYDVAEQAQVLTCSLLTLTRNTLLLMC